MQKGFAPIIILVGILVLASVGGVYYFFKIKIPEPKACTMDAKICPDGTSVGRVGPNCEFAPCPSLKPTLVPNLITGSERISWDVPAVSIPQVEEQKLKSAIVAIKIPATISQDTYLSITNASMLGNWALLSGREMVRTPQPVQPTGVFEFLAHKTGTDWKITTPDDPDFCQVLLLAPDTLISKSYYIGCGN